MKTRIGILFGGSSREREISFAGGRTVYDNLNKSLFEPVPLFIDSFGNIILLEWKYIYKGSIRDFYPPVEFIPESKNEFQVYAESVTEKNSGLSFEMLHNLGKIITPGELKNHIDFAFLCLHGSNGEDGRIQGLLEYYGIPYSGSGIFSSAFGMNKAMQKKLMAAAEFQSPKYLTLRRENVFEKNFFNDVIAEIKSQVGFPCVVKPANQGSSVGVSILQEQSADIIKDALLKGFFIVELTFEQWNSIQDSERADYLRRLSDIREGIGMPVMVSSEAEKGIHILHPENLFSFINNYFSKNKNPLWIEGVDSESEVLIEQFVTGREFSCIVIRNVNGEAVALPPTEIRKGNSYYDYRSKYLPGLSRKITPIDLPERDIENIRSECERLFNEFGFNVYARIDGFITGNGTILLNDPNTTSGMMPSSFFFHQAAEIGLNPSQFLTYIIRTSVKEQISLQKNIVSLPALLGKIDADIKNSSEAERKKIKIAVLLGGYSSERHISVESGRNVYEKLSSSEKYQPVPVFLTGDKNAHRLFIIPVNLLLKDNADDISDKILHFAAHPVTERIKKQCEEITKKYAGLKNIFEPEEISYAQLAELVDEVFIALHGRPGEDGTVQKQLEKIGLTYNGSSPAVASLTIDKYRTNEFLASKGFLVSGHALVEHEQWISNQEKVMESIRNRFPFPFIAKPVDDGCSSAVKRITSAEELVSFADTIFRSEEKIPASALKILNLKPNEEFPGKKEFFLVEKLIEKKDAGRFLEITGGLLTHFTDDGKCEYEIFEPSEALSGGDVLSLEEKFLAGEGQNITPARFSADPAENKKISSFVKEELLRAAMALNIEGYARIDAFVRIYPDKKPEVIFIEVNSLPGMTPATCIFHQAAINGYKPYDFIDSILDYGKTSGRKKHAEEKVN